MGNLVEALKIFRGKRVFITGDTGFKGSWLALWLSEIGAEVYGYALPAEREDAHFKSLKLDKKICHKDGDIRDFGKLSEFFDLAKPEFVFHLAAQALVRRSYKDPKETFDTNISGSVNLLECVRTSHSVKSLVFITSDKCYTNKEWIWGYRENDELGGPDPYSASKAAAELVFSAYSSSYFNSMHGVGCASVRAGNVIGGGDWSEDRIVPDCIKSLHNKKPIVLRKPQATRPWQHVLEPLSGYITLAVALSDKPKQFSGAWNFGPSDYVSNSVKMVAERIIKHWGCGELQVKCEDTDPHEAGLLRLNCDKANQLLGWSSRWAFDTTIRETADWYKRVLAGCAVEDVSCGQIKDYVEFRALQCRLSLDESYARPEENVGT